MKQFLPSLSPHHSVFDSFQFYAVIFIAKEAQRRCMQKRLDQMLIGQVRSGRICGSGSF